MRAFLIALQFLTILPIRVRGSYQQKDYTRALLFFPTVGLIIGLIISSVGLLPLPYPKSVIIILTLIVSFLITGGLHLDGLADTCDGFYGQKPKERRLEIMKDSAIGVMGALGLISIILLKGAFLFMVPVELWFSTLILMTLCGRASMILGAALSSYARESGTGQLFIGKVRLSILILSIGFTLMVSIALLQIKGLILCGLLLFPITIFLLISKIKIGGMTGDTLGALNEIIEVSTLAVLTSGLL
jgi:adenosylcobinamide-GDP ribazoletransferase